MDSAKFVQLYTLKIRSNYRQQYDADLVGSIAESILKHGFKSEYPIPVYAEDDSYIIIDGHTRYNACLQVARTVHSMQFGVWIVLKDKPNDRDFKLNQLAANELRSDPDDISKAIGYKQALDFGATIDDLCHYTAHKRPYIEDRLSLLQLVPQAQELVTKKHLGIKFAAQLVRLDSNFQHIALQAYIAMKSPTLDEFISVVNGLYTKQSQCSMFDLALFTGKPIETIIDDLKIERQKSRQELVEEVEALKKAREMDREYARTYHRKQMSAALKEIETLKRQLALRQKAS